MSAIERAPKMLTARAGSISATTHDSKHSSAHSPRSLSRLTIVRLPDASETVLQHALSSAREVLTETQAAPTPSARRRSASASVHTFASATFSKSGRPRNGSFRGQQQLTARSHTASLPFVQLSPAKVYDIARKASQPHSLLYNSASRRAPFVPLEDDIVLPFVNRPSEVEALISRGRNVAFMTVLTEIFPTPANDFGERSTGELFANAATWSYRDLLAWLVRVTRDEMEDWPWCLTLQAAILPRSAVLWERVRGLLGIPPEIIAEPALRIQSMESGRHLLSINAIHAIPYVPVPGLSESSNDRNAAASEQVNDRVFGLRISNLLSSKSTPSTRHATPLLRSRSNPSRGSIPMRSSPLVPNSRSSPGIAQINNSHAYEEGDIKASTTHRLRPKRESVYSRFPASFDKLTLSPDLSFA